MTSKKRIVRNCIIWILIIVLHLQVLNLIFLPKNTDALAATTVINGFYAEEKDSLDVVFFGSSQVALGISPMDLREVWYQVLQSDHRRSADCSHLLLGQGSL